MEDYLNIEKQCRSINVTLMSFDKKRRTFERSFIPQKKKKKKKKNGKRKLFIWYQWTFFWNVFLLIF